MKILKIELQNINSLKSNEPIVIDFLDKTFENVGLFAITGSTGAGKTTILDAITIALYHRVPRFNNKGVKAGLVDVVSYGTTESLSRVTFENDGEIYEAHWSLRLVGKNGKLLTNPKEEVRFKNISREKILAEKKIEVQEAIVKAIQLSYEQFLRSAMLAQGEFAAFLTANAKDKGSLLEQITGEEIYKKIGYVILEQKSANQKKVDAIKSKINNDDILSSEEEELLIEKLKETEEQIIQLKIDEELNSDKFNWFKAFNDNVENIKKLHHDVETLGADKLKSKEVLTKLSNHEKAVPLKPIYNDVLRLESTVVKNELEFLNITNNTNKAIEVEGIKTKHHQYAKEQFDIQKSDNENWQKKLNELSGLDVQISNAKAILSKGITDKNLKLKEFQDKTNELETAKINLRELKEGIKKAEEYVKAHQKDESLKIHKTEWIAQLTLRDSYFKDLQEVDLEIIEKKLEEQKQILPLVENAFKEEEAKFKINEQKLQKITEQYKEVNIQDILDQSKILNKEKDDLLTLKSISEAHFITTNKLNRDKESYSTLIQKQKLLATDVEQQENQLLNQKKHLVDAEELLSLKKTIQSFEQEREKLKAGEPCGLCGSINHPYVDEELKSNYVDEAKIKYETLKSENEKLIEALNKKQSTFNSNITLIQTMSKTIEEFDEELRDFNEKFEHLNFTKYSIQDTEKINQKIEAYNIHLKEKETLITSLNKIQKEKSDLETKLLKSSKQVSEKNKKFEDTLQIINQLNSKLKEDKVAKYELQSKISTIEEKLKMELIAFNLHLPEKNFIDIFNKEISLRIEHLEKGIKAVEERKNKLDLINQSILSFEKEYDKLNKELFNYNNTVTDAELKLNNHTETRNKILDISISIDDKKEQLVQLIYQKEQSLIKAQNELEEAKKNSIQLHQQKDGVEKLINQFKNDLKTSLLQFNTLLQKYHFTDRQDFEKVLLTDDEISSYTIIKNKLADKEASLKGKAEVYQQIENKLNAKKTFTETKEEILKLKVSYDDKLDGLSKIIGSINQKFETNNQIKSRNKSVFKELIIAEKELKKWTDLLHLLGGSKDAFNTYVQRLTLKNLIGLANIHLAKLNKRYSLKLDDVFKTGEELNFKLIDHYQTDEMRYVDTSSGGEKFIISLSLALALSDLASSNVSIDSLFIDEGFGTLDTNTLETVISTLETLQAQGKSIGIISHVENLKERIPTQIQVIKKSNGVSEVNVV